jgi:hypothetical protein
MDYGLMLEIFGSLFFGIVVAVLLIISIER